MAGERRVDEITVGDLVARAGVSRQVFYRHFRDRDDAVALAVTGAFAAAVGPGPEKPRPAASAATGHGNDPATVEDIDARSRVLELFEFAARHGSMCHNIVPSTVNQQLLTAYREALLVPCRRIATQGMAVLDTVAPLPAEAVTRFLVGGFLEVLRSWMEDPDATDLAARVGAALDTVDALLGISCASKGPHHG